MVRPSFLINGETEQKRKAQWRRYQNSRMQWSKSWGIIWRSQSLSIVPRLFTGGTTADSIRYDFSLAVGLVVKSRGTVQRDWLVHIICPLSGHCIRELRVPLCFTFFLFCRHSSEKLAKRLRWILGIESPFKTANSTIKDTGTSHRYPILLSDMR